MMKINTIFFFFWTLSLSIPIYAQDFVNVPMGLSSWGKDSTVSGFHKNGQLAFKYSSKNGGIWNMELYKKNGNPIYLGTLKDGNGTYENQYRINHRQVRAIGYYVNGQPDGNWQIYWDAKGKTLYRELLYRDGFIISQVTYDKKGRKEMEIFYDEKNLPKSVFDDGKINAPTSCKRYRKGKLVEEDITEYKKNKRPKTTRTYY